MIDSDVKDFLDNSHANYVRKLSRVVTSFYDAKLAAAGLSICYSQLFMLMALKGYGGLQRREFFKCVGQERTTVARNTELLEKWGLIKIHKEMEGRKTYLIGRCYTLTPEGEKAAEIGYRIWKEMQEKIEHKVLSGGYAEKEDFESLKYTCNEMVLALQAM